MGAIGASQGQSWPRGRQLARHLLAGALLNGVYLCTSWWAIERRMPAGVMSLLGALQPLAVATGSVLFLQERLSARAWAGLCVGLIGVVLVLAPLLGRSLGAPVPASVAAGAVASILAMSAGVMIQRSALSRDGLAVSSAVQNGGGALVALLATATLGDYRWDNSPTLWLAIAWSVLMLSAGALSLLVWMTRAGGATRVSLLLLLAPPLTALETWLLFGERLLGLQMLGFAVALAGVLLARTSSQRSALLSLAALRRRVSTRPRPQ
jgi:drug/metabolite transporter (DMT)-like permease